MHGQPCGRQAKCELLRPLIVHTQPHTCTHNEPMDTADFQAVMSLKGMSRKEQAATLSAVGLEMASTSSAAAAGGEEGVVRGRMDG